eukprot:evm.model.scf_222.2 EVM.evm.TU.scf_222.2   scf_222:11117-20588(-)
MVGRGPRGGCGYAAGRRRLGASLLSLLLTGALLATAECGDAQGCCEARTAKIVVVEDGDQLRKLREMCQLGTPGDAAGPGFYDGVAKDCLLAAGVSGDFTAAELQIIEECMRGGLKYIETDGQVTREYDVVEEYSREESSLSEQVQQRRRMLRKKGGGKGRKKSRAYRKKAEEESLAEVVSSPGRKAQHVPPVLWNLDRLDQRDLPLDGEFHYGFDNFAGAGRNVSVFVLDSGIRTSHDEFQGWGGRPSRAVHGWDFIDEEMDGEDCNGHGTHVASTAVGRMVGIAKHAEVVGVRVLDCHGEGRLSTVVAGLDWVASSGRKPAVVLLSLFVTLSEQTRAMEDAVEALIEDHGYTVVVASGNKKVDSCFIAPANVKETITVGGHNIRNKYENTSKGDVEGTYYYSNTGRCIDIFAPAVDIFGACGGSARCRDVTDSAYTWLSGTSMAAPHVAGVAAIYLGEYPDATPAEVKRAILSAATPDKIHDESVKPGTPNLLLYSNVFENSWPQP